LLNFEDEDSYSEYDSGYESQVLGNFQDQGFNDFTPAAEMFTMNKAPDLLPKTICIGEDISNIRQVIKRFGRRANANINKRYASASVSIGFFGKAATSTTTPSFTPIDYYSWIYRFYRGGVRHKFFIEKQYTQNDMVDDSGTTSVFANAQSVLDDPVMVSYVQYNATNVPDDTSIDQSDTVPTEADRSTQDANFTATQNMTLNPFMEVTVPYYANTHILPVNGEGAIALDDIKYNNVGFLYIGSSISRWNGTILSSSSGVRANVKDYVAAADDFSFGWLIGQPTIAAIA